MYYTYIIYIVCAIIIYIYIYYRSIYLCTIDLYMFYSLTE